MHLHLLIYLGRRKNSLMPDLARRNYEIWPIHDLSKYEFVETKGNTSFKILTSKFIKVMFKNAMFKTLITFISLRDSLYNEPGGNT